MEFTFITLFLGLIPALFFLLLPIAVVIALQVWICRRKNRWLGLILPAVTLLLSLLLCLSFGAYSTVISGGAEIIQEDGTVIQEQETEYQITNFTPQDALTLLAVFLIFNIPTAILLAIYFHSRNRQALQEELHKMTVQDLE